MKTEYDFVGSYSVEKCAAHLAILVYYRCYVQKLASIAIAQAGHNYR